MTRKWAIIDYLTLARLYFHRRIAGDFKPPPPTTNFLGRHIFAGVREVGVVCGDAGAASACNDLAGQIMREY